MKRITITCVIAVALISGCTSSQVALDDRRGEISWTAFCAARGYDLNDNTYTAMNEYLDSWIGSSEEEQAFIKAGVKPY